MHRKIDWHVHILDRCYKRKIS